MTKSRFPSPADDYLAGPLDLNAHLIKHPAATFLMRAEGGLLLKVGIHDGDILVVDRSLETSHGRIAITAVEGRLTARQLKVDQKGRLLLEDDPNEPILVQQDVEIWGVVTHVIHSV